MKNACLCFDCACCLYDFHKFKRKCLRMEEDLRLYVREHSEVTIVDLNDICGKEKVTTNKQPQINNSEIKIETNTIAKFKKLPCTVCNLIFPTIQTLLLHKIKHNHYLNEEKTDDDDDDDDETEDSKLHNSKLNFNSGHCCIYCGRKFSSKDYYEKHIEYHRKHQSNSFPYTCNICKSVYQSETDLTKHKSTHLSEKKCEKTHETEIVVIDDDDHDNQKRKKAINVPIKKESISVEKTENQTINEENFVEKTNTIPCNQCEYIFSTEKALITHKMHHHSRTRPCITCGRIFTSKLQYDKHMESHKTSNSNRDTAKKVYQCTVCKKKFPYMGMLLQHLKQRYHCCLCSFTTNLEKDFSKHTKIIHNIEEAKMLNASVFRSKTEYVKKPLVLNQYLGNDSNEKGS